MSKSSQSQPKPLLLKAESSERERVKEGIMTKELAKMRKVVGWRRKWCRRLVEAGGVAVGSESGRGAPKQTMEEYNTNLPFKWQ